MWLAKHLHRVPLIITLALPLLDQRSRKHRQSISSVYIDLLRLAAVSLLSTICALVAPAACSFLFVWLTGELATLHISSEIVFCIELSSAYTGV